MKSFFQNVIHTYLQFNMYSKRQYHKIPFQAE